MQIDASDGKISRIGNEKCTASAVKGESVRSPEPGILRHAIDKAALHDAEGSSDEAVRFDLQYAIVVGVRNKEPVPLLVERNSAGEGEDPVNPHFRVEGR